MNVNMCQCFPRINSSGKGKSFSFNKYCQIALQSFCTNLSSSQQCLRIAKPLPPFVNFNYFISLIVSCFILNSLDFLEIIVQHIYQTFVLLLKINWSYFGFISSFYWVIGIPFKPCKWIFSFTCCKYILSSCYLLFQGSYTCFKMNFYVIKVVFFCMFFSIKMGFSYLKDHKRNHLSIFWYTCRSFTNQTFI